MDTLTAVSDSDLLARMPVLVLTERAASVEVIEHLIEIDKRRLYLEQACASLYAYCMRLGYSEEGTAKRVRVTRLARQLPQVLDELRSGALHLTGLSLLAKYLTADNAEALLAEARGRSKRELELVIARWFPRPGVEQRIQPVLESSPGTAEPGGSQANSDWSGRPQSSTIPGKGASPAPFKLEPLSVSSYHIQFTGSAALYAKIQRARELVSHALPSGHLAELIERALDELIERETKRRLGAGRPRKARKLKAGSRHVPVEIARAVWERDGAKCTFVDAEGRRCSERRFLTLEHEYPYAFGGPPTVDNLCLLCSSHNARAARRVFGDEHIDRKCQEHRNRRSRERSSKQRAAHSSDTVEAKVVSALCNMGFGRQEVGRALAKLSGTDIDAAPESVLRAALTVLVPATAVATSRAVPTSDASSATSNSRSRRKAV